MNVQTAVSKIPSIFSDIDVMDADSHVSEWPDLWTSRAPSKWRDRVPQIRGTGADRRWFIDGDKPLGMIDTAGVILKDGSKDNVLGQEAAAGFGQQISMRRQTSALHAF